MSDTAARLREQVSGRDETFRPIAPRNSAETGLDRTFISNLILKTMFYRQEMIDFELCDSLQLPFAVIDEHVTELRREKLIEIAGTADHSPSSYVLRISELGGKRARQALAVSHYVGPAPVSLKQYIAGFIKQVEGVRSARRDSLRQALSHLVLPRETVEQIGPAFEAGRALFLFGEPGNGKSALAAALGAAMTDNVFIPHAVEVDGQIIKVLDPIFHGISEVRGGQDDVLSHVDPQRARRSRAQAGAPSADMRPGRPLDERWVSVTRPLVFVGGELDLSMLDLRFNEREGTYEAPLHMKANGGILIIDDFGRQLVQPRDLLNRWIVPLDKNVDFLTLHTGKKFPIPFHTMVVFATNLNPSELVDDAFLRRIPYKVELRPPDREEYREIFVRECKSVGVEPSLQAIEYIFRRYYEELGVQVRACHPRDILRNIVDRARWAGTLPKLTVESLEQVCRGYFLAT